MRRILMDAARARLYRKRGGGIAHVDLDEALLGAKEKDRSLIALDDVLKALSAVDKRKGRVVELRFFGGLSADETAHVLKVSRNGPAGLEALDGVAAARDECRDSRCEEWKFRLEVCQ